MKLGVCYYPEQWPEDRWPIDARMMREAGLSLVRLAEFSWQVIEPAEGNMNFDWLDRAIEILVAEGLEIVLGTPTAAPPPWLGHLYPETLPVDAQGRRRRYGSRRHYCPTSAVYRDHTSRIVTAMADRYGQHPSIVAWQIDNEFGDHDTARCYCDACATSFRTWLERKYGSIDRLNEAWGAIFWSQAYAAWEEIELPALTVAEPNPGHRLDFERFASDSFVEYQQLQLDHLRKRSSGKSIYTNMVGFGRDIDSHDLAAPLDFVSWDCYPTGYAEVQSADLYLSEEPRPEFPADAGDPLATSFGYALTHGLKQKPFWISEQQGGNINWGVYNPGIRPEMVRLWAWHAFASGAEAVLFFRWRASRSGPEQHHSGLLNHDASEALGYRQVLALNAERQQLQALTAAPAQASIALLLDFPDTWAVDRQPHRAEFSSLRHLFVFYRAAQSLGLPVEVVSSQADLDRYRIVIAPTSFLGSKARAETLADHVDNGGIALLGVRSGFKTPNNLVVEDPLPGVYGELVSTSVEAWHALSPGQEYSLTSSIEGFSGSAGVWAEALSPLSYDGSRPPQVLAHYSDGPFEGQPALLEAQRGAGQALYLGCYPTLAQASALLSYLAGKADVAPVANLEHGLLASRRGNHIVLFNFQDETRSAQVNGRKVAVPPRDLVVLSAT